MKIYYILVFFVCTSLALKCTDGSAYQCADITDSTHCTGVLSGRTCIWKTSACTYQTCEDLGTACSNQILEGKQCFKNSANSCVGANSCSAYDSQATCTSLKNAKCVWDITNPDHPLCRNANCIDIQSPDECMITEISGVPCYYWGNLSQCDLAICDNRSEETCNGKTSNGRKCIWNQGCKFMTCDDVKNKNQIVPPTTTTSSTATTGGSTATTGGAAAGGSTASTDPTPAPIPEECFKNNFSLSDQITCINQLNSAKLSTCTQVSACSDIKTEAICTTMTFKGIKCIWNISCTVQSCKDFNVNQCPATFGDSGCSWDATGNTCLGCGEITDGCICNKTSNCFWNYDSIRQSSGCSVKKCSLVGTSSECAKQSCYWNTETKMCGKTAADTGFTQQIVDKSTGANSTSGGNETEETATFLQNCLLTLVILTVI